MPRLQHLWEVLTVFFPHWMKLEVYCLNKWDEIANMKKKTGIESLKKLLLNYICR